MVYRIEDVSISDIETKKLYVKIMSQLKLRHAEKKL